MSIKLTKIIRIIFLAIVGIVAILNVVINAKKTNYNAVARSVLVESLIEDNEPVSPRLFTVLNIKIICENGIVSANVRNDFTFGFSTVEVYVYLYSSSVFTENYNEMKLMAENYTEDLNIFTEINSSCVKGDDVYWLGRMRYRIDNDAWKDSTTPVYYIDNAGNMREV